MSEFQRHRKVSKIIKVIHDSVLELKGENLTDVEFQQLSHMADWFVDELYTKHLNHSPESQHMLNKMKKKLLKIRNIYQK